MGNDPHHTMMCYCFSATSEETPYKQLLPYWVKVPKNREKLMWINISQLKFQQDCYLLVAFIVD